MTGIYAPTVRARRILIAVLAFALAVGFAVAASIAPAQADDPKQYSVTISDADEGPGDEVEVDESPPNRTVTLTFANVFDTNTQRLGAALADFGDTADLDVVSAGVPVAPIGKTWIATVDQGANTVTLQAASSGNDRLVEGESVSVDVSIATASGTHPPTSFDIVTAADQQSDDPDFGGGNEFVPVPPDDGIVHITVIGGIEQTCNAEQEKCSTGQDNGASTDCIDCKADGVLIVDHQAGICDPGGEFAGECGELWFADYVEDSGPDGIFYLMIFDAPKGSKIVYEDASGELQVARNCQPPHRTVNCVEKSLSTKDVKALKLDEDPRGGYR